MENSRNLCKTNRKAKVSFTAQNGAQLSPAPVIATGCGKSKKK
ncbi:MAG TPA: hypothetical protein VFR75_06700 [Solirubrobacterales bacterium]|nr:hypothetical protein [Solirubrobacterales bacterium]